MAHGHNQHHLVGSPGPHVDIVQVILGQIALVGPDHPFGTAGGPGGVHKGPGISGINQIIRFFRRGLGQPVFIAHIPARHRTIPQKNIGIFRNGQFVFDPVDQFDKGLFDDQPFTFRMIDDKFYVRSGQPEHQGDDDLSALGRPGIDIHPLPPVISQDPETVFGLHSQISKTVGQSAGAIVPLFKGKLLGFILPSQLVRKVDGIHLEYRSHRHPVTFGHDLSSFFVKNFIDRMNRI